MELSKIKDIKELYRFIDTLKGNVYLVDGNTQLDLKSLLCRVIVGSRFESKNIKGCYIKCESDEDQLKLDREFNER